MNLILSALRFLLYSAILLFLPISIFFIFLGMLGIYLVLFLYLVLLTVIYFFSERIFQRFFQVSERIQRNTEFSLKLMAEEIYEWLPELKAKKTPHFVIYQDPSPNMLIFKLPFRRGIFFMSQGMLTLLNESEVRDVICCALKRYRDHELNTSSVCSMLNLLVVSFIPKEWIQLILDSNTQNHYQLNLLNGLFFLIVFPLLRGLLTVGRQSSWRKTHPLPPYILKKIQKDQAWWTYARRLGFTDLYLAEPISS